MTQMEEAEALAREIGRRLHERLSGREIITGRIMRDELVALTAEMPMPGWWDHALFEIDRDDSRLDVYIPTEAFTVECIVPKAVS